MNKEPSILDKATRYIFALVALALVAVLFFYFIPTGELPDKCKQEKEMSFKGVIGSLVLDSMNPGRKFIVLTNGMEIMTPYTYGLWNEVKPGDSLVKEKGTLNYIIYEEADVNDQRLLNWDERCGQQVALKANYMFYACDPCAQYKVASVDDSAWALLRDQDILLKFSSKEEEKRAEDNIVGKNLTFRIWGRVLREKGKDAFPKSAFVVQVEKMEFVE